MAGKTRKAGPPAHAADPFAGYPDKLRHSTQNPKIVYVRANDLYALRGPAGSRELPLATLNAESGEAIRVYRGTTRATSARALSETPPLPVYSQGAEAYAIPTGRVLVRFADSIKAESRADDLKKLGYRIAQTLVYAPNAAWLESESGMTDALRNIERVERLEGVENVEPQFLSPRAAK